MVFVFKLFERNVKTVNKLENITKNISTLKKKRMKVYIPSSPLVKVKEAKC